MCRGFSFSAAAAFVRAEYRVRVIYSSPKNSFSHSLEHNDLYAEYFQGSANFLFLRWTMQFPPATQTAKSIPCTTAVHSAIPTQASLT